MPSTAITDHSYDEDALELIVTFVTGRRYAYESVPLDVAAGLDSAASKGGYFNRHIRDQFEFRQLD